MWDLVSAIVSDIQRDLRQRLQEWDLAHGVAMRSVF